MAYDQLLREGRINGLVLRNRIITGPMERSLANRDGTVTQRYIDYLAERARGGAGLIMVESTYIDPRGMGHLYQVGCHDEHVVPGLTRLADAIHREGARVGLELYFGGRQTPSTMSQRQPLAPSIVPCSVLDPMPVPRELTREEITGLVTSFAQAAERAARAGIDMIHLHGAHGYLLGSFLSPFSNHRQDEYGGDLAGRARFPLEVLAAVRGVVGPSYPIGYRLSADEYVDGGLSIADTTAFAILLADAGIDLIDVSGGIYESASMIIQGPEAPRGGFVANAAAIRAAVRPDVPVSVTQRLNDPGLANTLMERYRLDFVSMTRAFHADPHFTRKLIEDRAADILPCIACHHCTNLLEANLPAGCAANPYSTFERQHRPTSRGRRVAVIGGGPGGLHSARILARQGHSVVLYERAHELGGQMRYSSRVAVDYGDLVTYLVRQVGSLGIEVHTGTEVDLGLARQLDVDAIIVATGAGPGLDYWTWTGQVPRFDLFSALDRDDDDWEDRVAVLGGDSESCFVGLFLAGRGVEVHIFDPKVVLSDDKLSPGRDLLMGALEDLPTVTLHRESTVEAIDGGRVDYQFRGTPAVLEDVGAVVVGGRTSRNELYEALAAAELKVDLFAIGDAVRPRDVYAATHEAADVAARLWSDPAGARS